VREDAIAQRPRLLDLEPPPAELRAEALDALRSSPRRLPSKFFYDAAGAELFERITTLPEYYLTRTELAILHAHLPEMAVEIGSGARVVEFGSGSGEKTELLLRALHAPAEYLPIDISREQLVEFAARVAEEHPELRVTAVCADWDDHLRLPEAEAEGTTVIFFPGSSIGNLDRPEAEAFLARAARLAGPRGALLLGADLRKDVPVLLRAYDDAAGVTAAFNLNLLARLNRECATDFDLDAFEHRAVWNGEPGRIEMHLVSARDQTVSFPAAAGGRPAESVSFAAGEAVVTEHSHKYRVSEVEAMAAAGGWEACRRWTDEGDGFGVFLFRRAPGAVSAPGAPG
jgi:L-histidine Nalpha-methyltransferase